MSIGAASAGYEDFLGKVGIGARNPLGGSKRAIVADDRAHVGGDCHAGHFLGLVIRSVACAALAAYWRSHRFETVGTASSKHRTAAFPWRRRQAT